MRTDNANTNTPIAMYLIEQLKYIIYYRSY